MITTKDKQSRLEVKLTMPTQKTRKHFEGLERLELIKFIDGQCSCAYCNLAREVLRKRERQLRFY
jgi:hypothetical protein